MLTQLKNHAFSELHRKELKKLHQATKFKVKRLEVKLIMIFFKDAKNYTVLKLARICMACTGGRVVKSCSSSSMQVRVMKFCNGVSVNAPEKYLLILLVPS